MSTVPDQPDPGPEPPTAPPEYPPGEIPTGPPFDGKDTVPMLVSEFLGYLDNVARLARQSIGRPPEGKFFLVEVPPAGKATGREFATLDALVAYARMLYGKDTQVFCYSGQRMRVSKGGAYLFTPWGNHALFAPDPTAEADDDGFMGEVPQLIAPPPPPPADKEDLDLDGADEDEEGEDED